MSSFRVLHISDIHIGKTFMNSDSIAYRVTTDIKQMNKGDIRSIVVTGDIFEGSVLKTDELVMEAVDFFQLLIKQINIYQTKQITKEDIIFVPGNHDIVRDKDPNLQWGEYRNFLEKFYITIPDMYSKDDYSVFKAYQEEKVLFVGMNSCQIEKRLHFDKTFIDKLRYHTDESVLAKDGIDKNKLIGILEKQVETEFVDFGYISSAQLNKQFQKTAGFDDYQKIALFHHHFFLFPEIIKNFGDSSIVRNHAELTQYLKYMGVKTILHGHKHFDLERPYMDDDYFKSSESIIDVIAGGSLGSSRVEKHTFNVIDFYSIEDDIKLVQDKFIYNAQKLDIVSKQLPPSNLSTGSIELLGLLKHLNHGKYTAYMDTMEKLNRTWDCSNNITKWVSDGIAGFDDVFKQINSDDRNLLFLLYTINYRVLSFKSIVESDKKYFEEYMIILRDYFSKHIENPMLELDATLFHEMLGKKKSLDLVKKCDELIGLTSSKSVRSNLAFSMVGVFFTDLYLILTEYADNFYNETIKFKVNIKMEENKFHEYVPVPRILISSDFDRRSIYVQLSCKNATSHKMAVLFVKEFDLLITKFEEYFKLIGLKLYYIHSKISKNNSDSSECNLENYNFEAYIPTLLPLLTGDHIYSSSNVFARELIQNSMDAISVRGAQDSSAFDKSILIKLGRDDKGRAFFSIKDFGIGMDRYKIERYFTSIGRSFYTGEEYKDLNLDYKPISSFGIGFLSSFMVSKEIDVKTKHYLPGSEGLELHIPNYDGCFFIDVNREVEVGTEIKLYLDGEHDQDVNKVQFIRYIENTMLDIKYPIIIDDNGTITIVEQHSIRNRKVNEFVFFIPLSSNGTVSKITFAEILESDLMDHQYGILIRTNLVNTSRLVDSGQWEALNAGIRIDSASMSDLLGFESFLNWYTSDVTINFPPDWIQVDVSREKLTGFSKNFSSEMINNFKSKTIDVLGMQIEDFIEYSTQNVIDFKIIQLQAIINNFKMLCGEDEKIYFKTQIEKLDYLSFIPVVQCSEKEVIVKIVQKKNLHTIETKNKKGRYLNYKVHVFDKVSKTNLDVLAAKISEIFEDFGDRSQNYFDYKIYESIPYRLREVIRVLEKHYSITDKSKWIRFVEKSSDFSKCKGFSKVKLYKFVLFMDFMSIYMNTSFVHFEGMSKNVDVLGLFLLCTTDLSNNQLGKNEIRFTHEEFLVFLRVVGSEILNE